MFSIDTKLYTAPYYPSRGVILVYSRIKNGNKTKMKQAEICKRMVRYGQMTKAKEILTEARRNLKKKLTVKSRADRSITSKASGIKIPRTFRRRRSGNNSGSVTTAENPVTTVNDSVTQT